jgi:acetaldehyde dehydrogenase (acetylating)
MIEDLDLISIQDARNIARKSKEAQKILSNFDEKQIDRILNSMVRAANENAEILAKMAVEETGFGNVQDKIVKNTFASSDLYSYIKDMKTIGIIKEDNKNKIIEIAEPVGLLLGIIPSTNPTSTVIYKSIIAVKSRNGIVFSPHPSALNCTCRAAAIMNEAAVMAGAPEGIIGCISKTSMHATNELMKMPEVNMIIATGGSAMVKAAYSSGKPALGVGPGNAPAYIERTADIKKAARNIIKSKSFDYSTICASEQSVITEECIKDQVIKELKAEGAYFMTEEETKLVGKALFKAGFAMNPQFVGRSAKDIASKIGFKIPENTKVLIGEQKGVGRDYPLSYEKLTTVLAFYTVNDWLEACDLCIRLLNNGGVGHTLSIHTESRDMVLKFAAKPVFRILVNCPSSLGSTGVVTALPPSFTLGCGTWGGSSTSDNVTPMHLINIKRVAYPIKDFTDNKIEINSECSKPLKQEDDIDQVVKRVMKILKESGEFIGSR